jgi:hypothetical protein
MAEREKQEALVSDHQACARSVSCHFFLILPQGYLSRNVLVGQPAIEVP